MTKFDIIKKYIDEFDAYCLLETGCPDNEFDIESRDIEGKVSVQDSVEKISEIISNVFNYWFNYGSTSDTFMETAQKIKDAFIENNITD